MLVGVNAVTIPAGFGGGEERFVRKMLATIREVQPSARFVVFTGPDNHDSFEGYDRMQAGKGGRFGLSSDPGAALAPLAKSAGIDLLFSPLDRAPAKFPLPVVVFALDLRQWEPENLKLERRSAARHKAIKQVSANAAAIITPSESVQRKTLHLLEVGLDKTVIAPLGVDPVFGEPQPSLVEGPFLLAVGDTRDFKNVPRLRQACAQLGKVFPHNLVVVGRPCEAEPEDWGARVVRFEHIPTSYLAGLYQHCDAFIQPSLYEGSGVTVLEAMRAGAAVATSRTGGIGDIAGDTPFFFNPENVGSIVANVRRILEEDAQARQTRTKAGVRAAGEFTWERCAWKVLSAFKKTR